MSWCNRKLARRWKGLLICAVPPLSACSDPASPASHSRDIIYVLGETHNVFVVDPRAGRVLGAPGPVPEELLSPVMSSDSSTLYFTGYDNSSAGIYAVHSATFSVEQFYQLTFPPRVPTGAVWDFGGALAVAPGRPELYDGAALVGTLDLGDTTASGRVAIFDTASHTLQGSMIMSVAALAALPAGPVASEGGLVGFTYFGPATAPQWALLVIDPATRTITDSLVVSPPAGASHDYPRSLTMSPDGKHAYVIGSEGIYDFDLVLRQLVGVVRTNAYEPRLAISPDGARVYLIVNVAPDPGANAPPTTVRVFDANLNELPPLSFSGHFRGPPPILHDILVSRDNRSLYLEAGNRDFFGEGPLRVYVYDLSSGEFGLTTFLDAFGQGHIILGH